MQSNVEYYILVSGIWQKTCDYDFFNKSSLPKIKIPEENKKDAFEILNISKGSIEDKIKKVYELFEKYNFIDETAISL